MVLIWENIYQKLSTDIINCGEMTVEEMTDEEGTPVMSAPHPEQILMLRTDLPLKKYDMLRKASKQ